jgi:hypothetical protein
MIGNFFLIFYRYCYFQLYQKLICIKKWFKFGNVQSRYLFIHIMIIQNFFFVNKYYLLELVQQKDFFSITLYYFWNGNIYIFLQMMITCLAVPSLISKLWTLQYWFSKHRKWGDSIHWRKSHLYLIFRYNNSI